MVKVKYSISNKSAHVLPAILASSSLMDWFVSLTPHMEAGISQHIFGLSIKDDNGECM